MIERARGRLAHSPNADVVHGDFLAHDFGAARFDFVVAVATLHHMELEPAIERITSLLQPGGVVAVLGLARSSTMLDLAFDVAGNVDRLARMAMRIRRGALRSRDVGMPIVAPSMTYGEVRQAASRLLPGCEFRRLVGFRYLLRWTKP